MAYHTKADVQSFLNITLTANGETLVDAIIPAVEKYAESYCNRVWSTGASTDIVETFDGGQTIYFVSQPPIASLQSVTIDGVTQLAPSYYNYGSYLRFDTRSATGYQNVVVTYRTATTSIPADLKHALIRWTAEIFKSAEDAGKTAKRVQFGPSEVEFLVQDGIPKYVEMVLSKYRLSPV